MSQQLSCSVVFSDGWKTRWTESKHKSDYGQWKLSAGKFYGDAEADKGNSDMRIIIISETTSFAYVATLEQPMGQKVAKVAHMQTFVP